MSRPLLRALTTSLALACAVAAGATAPAPPVSPKVFRYAFPIAETGFDPAQVTDLYSRTVVANIFEAPLEYEYLARPVRLRPNTAAALPEVSADFKTFTLRLKPGTRFADDPAFGGKPRELTAADYVYSIKRHYDPRWKSGSVYALESAKVLGLSELRREAVEARKPFDYDREVDGVRALDRYTLQVRLAEPSPRFETLFADPAVIGAVAREVVEAYGDKVGEHPVGTGPFMLTQWRRSSRMVLERNPNYRDVRYDEQPPAGDARLQTVAATLKGRRLPLVDRIEVAIIDEQQPRWLSFINEEQDVVERVPEDFTNQAYPNNRIAPHLAKRGIGAQRYVRPDISVTYFAMEHPVVGGYTPEKVALRRAIALAYDNLAEARLVRRGLAVPAQSFVGPETWGYDPAFKSEMGEHDPAKARALLDMHGYVDRDGDGWRELPDGAPMTIEIATQPDNLSRQLDEQWDKALKSIGVRGVFRTAKWPENLKASRAGKLMMWLFGWTAGDPDAQGFLVLGYGPNKGQSNHARFDLPAYNRVFERQAVIPNGPERLALVDEAKRLTIAYMPYKVQVHRIWIDMWQPWVHGYHKNVFMREFWKYVDVDMEARARLSTR
jgi:ABC-type transport system substrate-binding protein